MERVKGSIAALVMAMVTLTLAGAAFAYPSLLGPTGSVNLPVAAVVPTGETQVAADFFADNTGRAGDALVLRALNGVAPNWEVGAGYTFQNGPLDTDWNLWTVNAKYMTPYRPAGADLAVGALYATTPDTDEKATQVYLVATKLLAEGDESRPAVRASLGVNWTKWDAGVLGSDSAFRPYVTVDLGFASKLDVTAEYQFKSSDLETDPISSIAVRYPFTPELAGEVGFSNALNGLMGQDEHSVFAGVRYTFGAK